ncbi:MAG: O-methyltransferase [Myxococcota bacterium]
MTERALTLWDKLLPNQRANNHLYVGEKESYAAKLFSLISDASDLVAHEEDLVIERSSRFPLEDMASNPVGLRLLQLLVRLTAAERVLEIGAFVGISAMYMARALPASGKLISIEKFDEFAEIARRNFRANGLDDRIDLYLGDAAEVIRTLPPELEFDLIFIDGNKERYALYFEALEPRLRRGGLFVVDDVLFHGDVLNSRPGTAKGRGVQEFLALAKRAKSFLRLVLPVGNGVMLLLKQ